VAGDWANDALYAVNWTNTATPFYLETPAVDS
jgi:hypothetical protein